MVFNVKNEESAQEFFSENALNFKKDNGRDHYEKPNVYYLMKDEILLKRTSKLAVGDSVNFVLSDHSANTKKSLINNYAYKVYDYDSVCVKLVFEDFKIEIA
jgi:hypothetical protein